MFSVIWHIKYLLLGDTAEKELYKEPILEYIRSFLFFIPSALLFISVFKYKINVIPVN